MPCGGGRVEGGPKGLLDRLKRTLVEGPNDGKILTQEKGLGAEIRTRLSADKKEGSSTEGVRRLVFQFFSSSRV